MQLGEVFHVVFERVSLAHLLVVLAHFVVVDVDHPLHVLLILCILGYLLNEFSLLILVVHGEIFLYFANVG